MSWFKTVDEGFTEGLNNSEKEKWSLKKILKPRIPDPSPVVFQLPKIWPLYVPSAFENVVTVACLRQTWTMITNCSKGSGKALSLSLLP